MGGREGGEVGKWFLLEGDGPLWCADGRASCRGMQLICGLIGRRRAQQKAIGIGAAPLSGGDGGSRTVAVVGDLSVH